MTTSLQTSFSSFISWIGKNKREIAMIGIGRISYQTFNFFFDDIAYPTVIGLFGWKGALMMSGLSFVQCATVLIWYQHTGKDWLGIGVIEKLKNRSRGFLAWLIKKSDVTAFLVLGLIQDPFEVTAYFKKADFRDREITKRDWSIFFASWLWTNMYWTFRSSIAALVVIVGWKKIHG